MDMEAIGIAKKYAEQLFAGAASGVVSHSVDEENNSITLTFADGTVSKMTIATPQAKVDAAVNAYLGENDNITSLGLATLKNVFSYINVTFLGVDNKGSKDNAGLLQTIIDSVPNGTTLYFPYGEYLLSHGITIDKSLQLVGDRKGRYLGGTDTTKIHGSCLKFMDTVSNDTMIVQGNNCWSLTMHNMVLYGNSGASYDDGLNDETIPYAQYRYDVINENVNGVLCVHSADITDCSFNSFSGYALSPNQAQNINQCKFYNNGIGVYAEKNDVMLRDCYITAGRIGIYCVGSKNLMVYDCYIDLLSEYGIYCESWLSGFINAYIDHTNYSGIHADTLNNLMVIANMHRNGMYNSGVTVDDLLVSDDATAELGNFSKACAVSCKWMKATTLQLGANIKNNDDLQASSKESPVIAVYAAQAWNSIVIGTEIDVKVRTLTELNALTLMSEKGTVKYSAGIVKTTPNVVVKSYAPSATTKACNVGDMWYNSYKKVWYVATEVTDSATTWERQYTTTEISDIISRLETLESASATTEQYSAK